MDPSSTEPPGPRRRGRARRSLRRALRAAGLLLAALAAAALARPLWLPAAVRWAAPLAAERWAGLRLELDVVEAADYDLLAVRGVRVAALGPEGALRSLRAEAVRVEFSLPRLLRGELEGLRALEARALELRVDASAPDAAAAPEEQDAGPPALPARLPRLDLRGLKLELLLPQERALGLEALDLRSADGAALALDVGRAHWNDGRRELELARAALGASYASGRLDGLRATLDGREVLRPSSVDASGLGAGRVAWDLDLAWLGGPARVAGELVAQRVALALELRAVALANLADLAGDASLAGRLDADARFDLALDDPLAATGALSWSATDVVVAQSRVDSVSGEARMEGRRVSLARCEAARGASRALLSGLDLPLDDLAPLALLRAARGRIELALFDLPELLGEIGAEVPDAAADARLALSAELAGGVLQLDALRAESAGGLLELDQGTVSLAEPARPELDVALRLDVPDLAASLAPWRPRGWSGRVSGTLRAHGKWPQVAGLARLSGEDVVVEGVALGALELDAGLDRERLIVSELSAHSARASLGARGGWNLRARELLPCALEARVDDLSAWLPQPVAAGSAELTLEASGALAQLVSRARLTAGGVRVGAGPPLDLELDVAGSGPELATRVLRVSAPQAELTATGRAVLAAAGEPVTIELAAARLQRGAEQLVLERAATITWLGEELDVGQLAFTGSAGTLALAGHFSPERIEARASATELEPMKLVGDLLGPDTALRRLDGGFELSITPAERSLATHGKLAGLRLPGVARGLSAEWDLRQRDELLEVERLAVTAGAGHRLTCRGRAPLDPLSAQPLAPGAVALDLTLASPALEDLLALEISGGEAAAAHLSGALSASLELRGPWEGLLAELGLSGTGLAWRDASGRTLFGPAGLELSARSAQRIELEAFELASEPSLTAAASGSIGRVLDLRELTRDPAGWAAAAPLDLALRLAVPDLAGLRALFESLGLAEVPLRSGSLSAGGTLAGSAADPSWAARVEIADGSLRLGGGLPTIDPLESTLRLAGREVVLERVRGELGGAPFTVGGRIDWSSGEPRLDLTLAGENLLLYRERGIRVRSDARLAIVGPLTACAVTGELNLSDVRYAKNFRADLSARGGPSSTARGLQIFRFRDPPLSTLAFDVAVHTRTPVRVENTTLTAALRPELHLGGSGELPVLVGEIYLDPTRLRLPGGPLGLESGTVHFDVRDPFVPTLALNGGLRARGYDVRVTVAGAYDAPEVTLSSTPPLPDRDLLMLVLLGQPPAEERAAGRGSDAARTLAVYLARDWLARLLDDESAESEESLVDRFDFRTGADVTRSGADTFNASFRLATSVLVGRDRLFLTAERDVYDYYNYGLRLVFRFR